MAVQRELEVKILAILYARVHRGSEPVTKGGLKKIVKNQLSISDYRFDDAFSNIQKWGYLKSEDSDQDDERFRLSSRGVDWFEGWFWLEEGQGNNFKYHPRRSGTIYVDKLYIELDPSKKTKKSESGFNLNRWGAIATILALPLAIILWWLS